MSKNYIQFPLNFLKLVWINPKMMNDIIDYGIVNFGLKQKYEQSEVVRQLAYCYYRKNGAMLSGLLEKYEYYIKAGMITVNDDYNGFSVYGNYDPVVEIYEIERIFEDDDYFKDLAVLNYRINQSAKLLGYSKMNADSIYQNYLLLKAVSDKHEQRFGTDPYPSIAIDIIADFCKQDADIELFCCYIAIRSLIGKNHYTATTKNFILMRMFGAKKLNVLSEVLKDKYLSDLYYKYQRTPKSLRCFFNKLFKKLLNRQLLKANLFDRKLNSYKFYLSCAWNTQTLKNKLFENRGNDRGNKSGATIGATLIILLINTLIILQRVHIEFFTKI